MDGASEVFDPETGKSSPTGTLPGSCDPGSSITSLSTGQVLVTGVSEPSGEAAAWLFDPGPGQYETLDSPGPAWSSQTAVRLADGRVLIAGGGVFDGYTAEAVVYDPSTRKFTKTGSLRQARENALGFLLGDGRILVVGGDQGDTAPTWRILASAEIFDPTTGTFSSAGSMHLARTDFAGAVLPDGRVLVLGGEGDPPGDIASAEIYDPASGAFSLSGSMSFGRVHPNATLLLDGRVLVSGGVDQAETYSAQTGTFSPDGVMDLAKYGTYGAVRLGDGRVFFPGNPSGFYWP